MTKAKKRPSKKKKAILKILKESKELESSKKAAAVRTDTTFTAPNNSVRSTLAHKNRPDKKRG